MAKRKQKMSDLVPTNWLDSLLTGPGGIGTPPYQARDIEHLLRGIQDRIRTAEAMPVRRSSTGSAGKESK